MKNVVKILLVVLMIGLWFTPQANAITAWYQPTPLPAGISESANHIRDGWIGSYYNTTFTRDDKMQAGGWGDVYRSYLNMDLDGLPKDPANVALWLRFYPSGATVTPFQFCIPNSAWDTTMTWSTQPSFLGCTGMATAPSTDSWAGWWITSWYQNWQNGVWGKHGVMLNPQYNNNNFDFVRSSRYANDGYRPILQIDFTPTLELKMPFDGNRWSVTTEIGGVGCAQVQPQHQGNGYFSIDFSWKAKDANGNMVYSSDTADIPILAAAGGTVVNDPQTESPSAGYFVRIEHPGTSGITTGYLHMKSTPFVHYGQSVVQGQLLGYMGATGNGVTGVHLDFNVQFNGSGTKDQAPLAKIMMDGWLLKSFQVDGCTNGNSQRYYPSSNVMIP